MALEVRVVHWLVRCVSVVGRAVGLICWALGRCRLLIWRKVEHRTVLMWEGNGPRSPLTQGSGTTERALFCPLRRTRGTVASVVPGISLRIRSRRLAPGTVDQRLSSECVGVARVEKYAITMYWTVYVNYDGPWLPTSGGGDSWLFR